MTDTGFKLHNARATTAHQTPPPHLSALMLVVDNYTIIGHARKHLHLPSTTVSSVSYGGAARVAQLQGPQCGGHCTHIQEARPQCGPWIHDV